ncbi:MAG: hypothetical protein GX248_01195 [Peptococcaceae bacterium]|jgi:hypothetical protein|nr:hypothetical protein [Peptococcaceae bacterium]
MKIVLVILILGVNYYTFTYAKSLWKDDHNKLAACGVAVLALLAIASPVFILFFRYP